MMALLEVENLGLRAGRRELATGFSLSLEAGQRVGIAGGIGAGMTPLALTIAGFVPAGIAVTGTRVFSGRRLGLVRSDPAAALDPSMTIGEQIAEAVVLGRRTDGGSGRVGALLAEIGFAAADAGRFPETLSLAERQSVLLALALASEPELLVCDEPTRSLDVAGQRVFLDILRSAAERRSSLALLLFSRELRVIGAVATEIVVLAGGTPVERGPLDEVLLRPQHGTTKRLVAAGKPRTRTLMRSPIGDPLLEVRGVSRRFSTPPGSLFGQRSPVAALDAVSFSIRKAEAVALVGPAGAGKSVLSRLIAGLDRTSRGDFLFERQVYRGSDLPSSLRSQIAMVFPDPASAFDPHLPVGTSLAEALRLDEQLIIEEQADRMVEAMRSVGLTPEDLARMPADFGLGDLQRLALARALMSRPSLVILDDPVSRLEPAERSDVLMLINRLRSDYGLTMLITARDFDLVRLIADRALVMEAGRILDEGITGELLETPIHPLTRQLGESRLPEPGLAPEPPVVQPADPDAPERDQQKF